MDHDSTSVEDSSIVAAILAGERDRFGELVRRYESALFHVARSRLGRREWAEEVVQETFWCVCKSLHTYDSRFRFRTWLWSILLNQCRRHMKQRARRSRVRLWSDHGEGDAGRAVDFVDQLPADEAEPPEKLLAAERLQRLDCVLALLPEQQADALRLRFFGELKYREIAEAMDCSLSTAKNRVRWGLEKMAKIMNEEDAGEHGDSREASHARRNFLQ